MTKDELKEALEEYFGLEVEITTEKGEYWETLLLKSPRDIVLLRMDIHNRGTSDEQEWRFAGYQALPDSWSALCSIGRKAEKS